MNDHSAPTDIKFMDRNPPSFSQAEAERIAKDLFGLAGKFRLLDSERDQNFHVAGDGAGFVLKFANAEEDPGVIDFQTQALLHIEDRDPGLGVPRVVRSRHGNVTETVTDKAGVGHLVRVVTFLPGTLLEDLMPSPALLRDVGAKVARLDRALTGFFHPHARNPHPWDITRAGDMRPHTHHIADKTARRHIENILDRFIGETGPAMSRLRHQVIHSDATHNNVVVDDNDHDRVSGILDFGDMVYAPLLCELAMAVDTLMTYGDDPIFIMGEVAAGFDAVLALEEDEVDLLFDAVLTRLAISATIIAWRRSVTPEQPGYLREYEKPLHELIATVMGIGADKARAALRHRLRFPPYCPPAEDTTCGDGMEALLARRYKVLGKHLSLFYERPIHMVKGRGAWLYDATGKAYVDAYNNVPVVGHAHPHVVRTLSRQAAALNTNTRYVYEIVLEYAERLTATLPDHLSACTFVNSGSEANDIAWRMAKLVTGRKGAIIMEDAYHGITEAIADLSPHHPDNIAAHVRTLLSPDPYRGPYRTGEEKLAERYAADADRAIAELDKAGLGTACFMIDTSYCSNGIPDVPEGYTRMVAEKVRAAGGLVIADEVQYGFGRPGTHMWGFASHGVEADFVTMGKPIGNGIALGAVVTTQEIMKAFGDETGLFSTFGGNPVACAAGYAVMDVLEWEGLQENARVTGDYLRDGLRALMQRYPLIGDVRGRGLIAGVEIVKDRETLEPAPDEMKRIMNRMKELGVLTGREGHFGNVFKIRPPLAFKREHADMLVEAMDRALSEM